MCYSDSLDMHDVWRLSFSDKIERKLKHAEQWRQSVVNVKLMFNVNIQRNKKEKSSQEKLCYQWLLDHLWRSSAFWISIEAFYTFSKFPQYCNILPDT